MSAADIRLQAERELAQERFRAQVEHVKDRLRARRPVWHRLFPFIIKIERRSK